ncbi:Omp28-related outer membrane protein, partial [candidate division KSB1 bacterium]|nr:Omp28-related outer membrane protein [candidate division KSB1 bacterium]
MKRLNFKRSIIVFALLSFMSVGLMANPIHSNTTRNPVLEFCTGTWCPWCPCGHRVIHEDLQPFFPNAIFLAYHGGDLFDGYPGSDILSRLGFSAYPTGVVGRSSGIVSYYEDGWYNAMVDQLTIPATVAIDLVQRSYNPVTREFYAVIDFTALETLSGDFNYSVILVEDSLIASQNSNNTCTPVPGVTFFPEYVHDHVVRKMINGSLGEQL